MFVVSALSPEARAELAAWVDERIQRAVTEASMTEWMDVAALARYLGRSEKAVRHLAARGRIPVHREGSRLYFRRSEVDRALSRPT